MNKNKSNNYKLNYILGKEKKLKTDGKNGWTGFHET